MDKKCPFRKITKYTETKFETKSIGGKGWGQFEIMEPCAPQSADTVTEKFAECLKHECPYYQFLYTEEFGGSDRCKRCD